MFGKKKCYKCGEGIRDGFRFCPKCGMNLSYKNMSGKANNFMLSGNMFKDFQKIFSSMNKDFGASSPRKPRINFRMPGGGGISIIITSVSGMRPKVSMKNYEQFRKPGSIAKERFGANVPIEDISKPIEDISKPMERSRPKKIRIPKVTEEPETEIKDFGTKQIITIKLPDVKSVKDVEIRKMEHSIEVKAFAGDKAYFKLIPIKGSFIENKKLEDGILKLEIRK